ncbi:MAG TPA: ubiquitin-like domain-containing protein [Spirochaetia bacterium]|nr:ubiquitin-like domain-containing protein [Spirochaetia bacterium]
MGLKAADGIRHWITSRQISLRTTLLHRINRIWILVAALTAMMITATYLSAQPVTLVVHGQAVAIRTSQRTVGDLLADRNVRPGQQDRVMPAEDSPIYRGEVIRVSSAVPVRVQVAGKYLDLMTARETVAGVLKENGIALGPNDQVQPAPATQVAANMIIRVDRMTTGTEVKNVPLPFSTRQESSPDLFRGVDRIMRLGRLGLEKQVWQVSFRDGVPVNKTLIQSQLIQAPQDQLVQVGALGEASRGGNVLRFSKVVEVRATAYTADGSDTASGTVPRAGTVAVDPAVIPLGSRLYVEGYGYGTALDTGGAITGKRIDLFFDTFRETDEWGVRYVRVFVLE